MNLNGSFACQCRAGFQEAGNNCTGAYFLWWFLGVADTNDVIQKIEKTLNNTHTTTQKLTNNSFRNAKKHPFIRSKLP